VRKTIGWVGMFIVVGWWASGALATVYQYEMNQEPSYIFAGGGHPMTRAGGGFGKGSPGPPATYDYAANEYCGLQNGTNGPAGSARFSDTGYDTGGNGYKLLGLGGTDGGFTVDMRVKGEEVVEGLAASGTGYTQNRGRSMVVAQQTLNGTFREAAGIQVEPGTTGGNSLHLDFSKGSSGVYDSVDLDKTSDTEVFRMVRLSLPNNGTVKVYDLEHQTADSWNLLKTVALKDFTTTDAAGFVYLNSIDNATTGNSKWLADWVRIDTEHALGGTDPIMPMPEPAMLVGFLALGLLLTLRRRQ